MSGAITANGHSTDSGVIASNGNHATAAAVTATEMDVDATANPGSAPPVTGTQPAAPILPLPPIAVRRTSRGKHALSVAPPIGTGPMLGISLSPSSDAKRHRTGEYTPNGSNLMTTAQWATDIPMSPATALVANSMANVSFSPRSNAAAAFGSSSVSPTKGLIPPSPLPPTHPHTYHYPASPSLPTMNGKESTAPSVSLPPASHQSPSRSGTNSSASSPSSAFSLGQGHGGGGGSGSSASTANSHLTSLSSQSQVQSPPTSNVVSPVQLTHSILSAPQHATVMHSPIPEDDDEDVVLAGSSSSSSRKKHDNRQGASCHQCKTTKNEKYLLFCTTKAGGSRKRKCRKKYCDSCLSRTYNVNMMQLLADGGAESFICPSCQNKCTCAGCNRKAGTGGKAQSAQHSPYQPTPAVSLATPNKRDKKSAAAAAAAVAAAAASSSPAEPAWPQQQRAHPHPPAATVLPPSGGFSGRAASAPIGATDFYDDYAPMHETHEEEEDPDAQQSFEDEADAPNGEGEEPPANLPSPPNMDAIASLLLQLSTTSGTGSTTAPASVSDPVDTTLAPSASSDSMNPTQIRANALRASHLPPTAHPAKASASVASTSPLNPFTMNARSTPPLRPAAFPESMGGFSGKRGFVSLAAGSLINGPAAVVAAAPSSSTAHVPTYATKYASYLQAGGNTNGVPVLPSSQPQRGRTTSEASGLAHRPHPQHIPLRHSPHVPSTSAS